LPFTLFRISNKTKIVILEMGMNHMGEISYLSKLAKPSISMITNIGSAHIENLGSRENIARAKVEITEGMELGSLYIPNNIDYKEVVSKKCQELSISLIEWDLIPIDKMEINSIMIKYNNNLLSFPYPSKELLSNWSGVSKISEDIGVNKREISEGLKHFQPAKGRLNILSGNFKIIDDCYNANLESMKSSINIAKNISENHNLILILGDIKESGEYSKDIHSELGKYLNSMNQSLLITYGEDSKYISDYYQGESFHYSQGKDSTIQIIDLLKSRIKKDDVVLIKGSRSMKMEEIVEILDSKLNQQRI
jgi:UDP-N-acetylmuramoyl-tripeptide--D-alanyl-D-alanine ligase